jgi:peptidoglycan/xylan/chitin deacetylase (PgdA/CDA1 family)
MINAGWEIDSHTMTHAHLPSLGPATLWHEVAGSRAYLHAAFHVPIHSFCYPYGAYTTSVITAVRRAGYLLATTTQPGLATPAAAFTLPRIRVTTQTRLTNLAKLIQSRPNSRDELRLERRALARADGTP